MKFGITTVSVAPLRAEAAHSSEMTSQLLFGERFSVLSKEKDWLYISCAHDEYEAWLSLYQANPISKKDYEQLNNCRQTFSFDLVGTAISNQEHIPVILGSSLPNFDGLSFQLLGKSIVYNGQVLSPDFKHPDISLIHKVAYKYLNAPFHLGGRSPFGIDASGFVQVVLQQCGIRLPRTVQHQQQLGRTIHLLGEAAVGDLLFFASDNEIDHVGLLIDQFTVIHCEEKVKISQVDNHGMINPSSKKYSHRLKSMKRLV